MKKSAKNISLQQAAEIALQQAKLQGASAAEVGVSHSKGLSVTVRQGDVETLEHNNDKGLALTVYFDQQKANASTSDFSLTAIADAVSAACEIAKHTQADDCSGLADAELMATDFPDLSLCHPWKIDVEQAVEIAMECEQAGREIDNRISNSEGASVSSHQGERIYANSHGFIGAVNSSRHSLSCTLIADDERGMQRDYWYTIARDAKDLETAKAVGVRAANNTLRRLNAKPMSTGSYPVIFSAEIAPSLFGSFIGAISGGSLYRKSSFLLDHLGKQVFPDFIRIHEQPLLKKGLGSAAFDGEGVTTQTRDIVSAGILQSYVLGSYSARKLGMRTTANAGGVHNLTIDAGDLALPALLKEMGTGVLITELMGMGVNIVTGDYSQGAAGFWVENGEIQYPVDEFTIASNLAEMFMGIQAIGSDVEIRGNTRTGSVWIDRMMVAAA
ncbi:MAG: metalloprotease PmbA [Gammaproteobacteria bacterium]|nr:MAG: metalloprotease PmbA [Gammaproteobacteria bacterium]